MSAARALMLMAQDARAVLARCGAGYGVFVSGDRRRRPRARLSAAEAAALASDGAIVRQGETFVLAPAGAKRAARAAAAPEDAFTAQHAPIRPRAVITAEAELQTVRAVLPGSAAARLGRVRDADGRPWFSAAELAAAERLRRDWEAGQSGLVRASDWTAPPQSGSARGPGNAAEHAMAEGLDARRRVEAALARLAAPLRRIVERACLHEDGFEAIERLEGWPARSAKLALKLALAQLAARP